MNSTERFSNRVENYVRYRPDYPPETIEFMQTELGLSENSVVADIGSGTGIFARRLLEIGCTVYGVEPNKEMRTAGEKFLAEFSRFHSIDGTAENTNLPKKSLTHATAAQAFHWFDIEKSEKEFARILQPGGYLVLIWNNPQVDANQFMCDYERLKEEFGTDFQKVRNYSNRKSEFNDFLEQNFSRETFYNEQEFDFEGLKGRALSSSYIPNEEHQNFNQMLAELKRIFEQNAENGTVKMLYDTHVYYRKF